MRTSFFDFATTQQCSECCIPDVNGCSSSISAQDYQRAMKGFKVNKQYNKCLNVNCANEKAGCGWVARGAFEETWTSAPKGIPSHLAICKPCSKLRDDGSSHIVGCRPRIESDKLVSPPVSLQPHIKSSHFMWLGDDAKVESENKDILPASLYPALRKMVFGLS